MNNIFLLNKYTKWYFNIIQKALTFKQTRKTRGIYVENHHIIPTKLGGSNLKENKVFLSAREHFVCHKLLTKMTEGLAKQKMWYAIHRTIYGNDQRYIPNSRVFQEVKIELSKIKRLPRILTEEHRQNIATANRKRLKGTTFTNEWKSNMSKAHIGLVSPNKDKKFSDEWKANLSVANKGKLPFNTGQKLSEEHKESIRQGMLGRKISEEAKQLLSIARSKYLSESQIVYTCEHCNISSKLKGNITRWHNENCKQNTNHMSSSRAW